MTTIEITRASDVLPEEEIAALRPSFDQIAMLMAHCNAVVAD